MGFQAKIFLWMLGAMLAIVLPVLWLIESRLGAASFVNHLVWHYGLGGSSPRRFARKHDDILYHAAGPAYWFEAPRVPATSRRLAGQTKKATDVLDVPAINNQARERTGWPTQKPGRPRAVAGMTMDGVGSGPRSGSEDPVVGVMMSPSVIGVPDGSGVPTVGPCQSTEKTRST